MPEPVKFQRGVVVEDQSDTRVWLATSLKEAFGDIAVESFASLAPAMEWVRAQEDGDDAPQTVVLIDLVLPDGSGVDLIREIVDRRAHMTPIVVSIYDDDAHLFDAIAAGAEGYILKDERTEALIRHLREIEMGEPPLSPSIARRMLTYFQERLAKPNPAGDDGLLTARERDVLGLLGRGLRLSDAAGELGLTRHTVAGYVKVIYSKLNISSRAEAALEAMKRGLL